MHVCMFCMGLHVYCHPVHLCVLYILCVVFVSSTVCVFDCVSIIICLQEFVAECVVFVCVYLLGALG